MNERTASKRRGFTLIELLVVISIIGMLSSVILVALQGARQKGIVGAALEFSATNYQSLGAGAFGYWNFDDPAGPPFSDLSGNGMTLSSPAGKASRDMDTPTGSGGSAKFAGISDLAWAGTGKQINGSNGYSTSIWIKPSASAGAGGISGQRFMYEVYTAQKARSAYMFLTGGGTALNCGGVNNVNFRVAYTVQLGVWQNLVCSWNASQNTMSFYVNGKLIGTDSANTVAPDVYTIDGVTVVAVGAYTNSRGAVQDTNYDFNGNIDDFAIYTQPLAVSNIKQIYAEGLSTHRDLAQE